MRKHRVVISCLFSRVSSYTAPRNQMLFKKLKPLHEVQRICYTNPYQLNHAIIRALMDFSSTGYLHLKSEIWKTQSLLSGACVVIKVRLPLSYSSSQSIDSA